MVDVGEKPDTKREAAARGRVYVSEPIMERITKGMIKKGDVPTIAELAGIMGAKKTSDWIPLCHPLPLTKVEVKVYPLPEKGYLEILAQVACTGKTGVEMEALTAVSAAALTVYDMCKAIDKSMVIGDICLLKKSGGKSGCYERDMECIEK